MPFCLAIFLWCYNARQLVCPGNAKTDEVKILGDRILGVQHYCPNKKKERRFVGQRLVLVRDELLLVTTSAVYLRLHHHETKKCNTVTIQDTWCSCRRREFTRSAKIRWKLTRIHHLSPFFLIRNFLLHSFIKKYIYQFYHTHKMVNKWTRCYLVSRHVFSQNPWRIFQPAIRRYLAWCRCRYDGQTLYHVTAGALYTHT